MIYMKLFLRSQRKSFEIGKVWKYHEITTKKKKGGEEERSSFIKRKSFEIERFKNIEKLLRKKRKWEKNDIN